MKVRVGTGVYRQKAGLDGEDCGAADLVVSVQIILSCFAANQSGKGSETYL